MRPTVASGKGIRLSNVTISASWCVSGSFPSSGLPSWPYRDAAMNRVLEAEILDHLDPADPRALRSRRDLRLIDGFLGNSRWMLRSLGKLRMTAQGVVELGAGEGILCRWISGILPEITITGLDRIAPPERLASSVRWVRGDFMETLPAVTGSVCCGALILHHFDTESLRKLGRELSCFSHLLFTEPHRSPFPLAMAGLISPLVGKVTRHDMPASIKAGFRLGELPLLLGLTPSEWIVREQVTLRGSLRFSASRR